jgi:hypothetical protein
LSILERLGPDARSRRRRALEARLGPPPAEISRAERDRARRAVVSLSVQADLRFAVPLMTDAELAARLDEAVACASEAPYWDFYDLDPASGYVLGEVREVMFPSFIVAELVRRELLSSECRAAEDERRRRRRAAEPDVVAEIEGGRLFVDDLLDRMNAALRACSDWWRPRGRAA